MCAQQTLAVGTRYVFSSPDKPELLSLLDVEPAMKAGTRLKAELQCRRETVAENTISELSTAQY